MKLRQKLSVFTMKSTLTLFLASVFVMPSWSGNANERMAGEIPVSSFSAAHKTSPEKDRAEAAPLLIDVSMNNVLKAGRVGRSYLAAPEEMRAFYESRANRPYWVKNYGQYERAGLLIERLEAAWMHGLNPDHYHIEQIRKLAKSDSYHKKARLELLLSDAFVRYAYDLSGFRFAPDRMKIEAGDWRRQASFEEILGILSSGGDFEQILQRVEPQGKTYKALQKELVSLVNDGANEARERAQPIQFEGLLRPGEGHKSVPLIRARLGLAQPEKRIYEYDEYLQRAVMDFQEENGLEPDGKIGDITLQFMNRTRQDRIEQILVNLERYRWMEGVNPEKFIMVNIPSGELWGIENGQVKVEMPVIVGKPWRRTRIFKTEITGVRFNPDWTVPPTIKRFDILPELRRDIGYLQEKGMALVKGRGENAITLDPAAIDWNKISLRDLHDIRIIQMPGDHNPLGRIRILMPNDYNMYLHDTNHPELFEKQTRQLSSGCMRMKYPEEVAKFVMNGQSGWNDSMVHIHRAHFAKTDLKIEKTIPSYTVYYTAWVGDDGKVVFGPDVYGYDKDMIALMRAKNAFVIPAAQSATSLASNAIMGKAVTN